MNPDRLYMGMKLDALVDGIVADRYTTFVAMPFRNHFNYISQDVFNRFCEIVESIDHQQHRLEKPFARPIRVDVNPPNAADLTEQIANQIMRSHFFLGDLSFGNHGVLLETGIAMAIKPTESITLISQGSPDDLHFDITVNRVNTYTTFDQARGIIQASLVAGARDFERRLGRGLFLLRGQMTPEALLLLHIYGEMALNEPAATIHHAFVNNPVWANNYGDDQQIRLHFYSEGIRELREKGLIFMDYQPNATDAGLAFYGYKATRFGAEVIRRTWPQRLGRFRSPMEDI